MRKGLLILAVAVLAMLQTAWAYDFSATSPSGHTLYYEIISGTENIATVTETSYSIKNLKLGKYNYSVRSVNGSKYSEYVDGSVELVAKDIDSIQIGQERTQTGIGDPVSSETIPFGFNMGTTAYSWVEIPYSASLFEEGLYNILILPFYVSKLLPQMHRKEPWKMQLQI